MDNRRVTAWFLAAVSLAGLLYVCFEWTPSSYGIFLGMIDAPQFGPDLGVSRVIRSDEWSILTPSFQAAVRNHFQRINETSFYREDLRNFIALPLKDWGLLFKPQMWAFFFLPPALAFSIYHAFFICLFLTGYVLLFRQLGVSAWLAIGATLLTFFSGFTQFWWTTWGPLMAILPWILLIALRPIPFWTRALLCIWTFPVLVLSHTYPALLVTFVYGSLLLILAFRPLTLRSPSTVAAVAIGTFAAAFVVAGYYGPVLAIMRNTVYPGRRVAPSGGTPILVVLSQLLPFLTFHLADYHPLTGENICEIGTLGSFFTLLTLSMARYRALWQDSQVRRTLSILLAGFLAITVWQLATLPPWIGRVLILDKGASQRWFFISGLLLLLASLTIWSHGLISTHPARVFLFVLLGPVASLIFKFGVMLRMGESREAVFSACQRDLLLCGFAAAIAIAACYAASASRTSILLMIVVYLNVYAFGRFNPLQPAGPIFDTPDTDVVEKLRQTAAASPDGTLVAQAFGATLNGIGFRSVAHALLAPRLALFRSYFPSLGEEEFQQIFNRYGHIQLSSEPLPYVARPDVIRVPIEVFSPVRNIRRFVSGPPQPAACSAVRDGNVESVVAQGTTLTITGWAPWTSETETQGIRVLTRRSLRFESLRTIPRPDIAGQMRNYNDVKSGFELRISSSDSKPLPPDDLTVTAFGTARGDILLACCACP